MFKALDLNALSKEDPRFLLDSFTSRMGRGEPVPPEHFVNDLEPPAFQCIPDLKKIKDRLLVCACGVCDAAVCMGVVGTGRRWS